MIIAQYMAAAALFTVAMMHALVWTQRVASKPHLLFALTAAAAGGNAITEAWIYGSHTIAEVAPALQWYVGMSGFWAIGMVWFIVSYTCSGRLGHWLAIVVSVEMLIALTINFWSPTSFIYTEITGLRQVSLPWGEVISLAEGISRSYPFIAELSLLVMIVIVVNGCRSLWRAGQRRRAWLFGSTVSMFMVLFASHATLVDMSMLDSPYLSTYGFLAVVLVISYDMAREVVRASVLNEELQQKDAQMRAAVDDERNRIAGELHDSVTQTLFSTVAIADALPEVWDRHPDEARRGLEELRQITRGALAEMRTLLLELHPSVLLEKSLGELLRQLAEATRARTRIDVMAEIVGQRSLPDEVQIALYRIAQESLNNIIKHAQASFARISLTNDTRRVILVISDDGHGFDPQSVESGRLGLIIMRKRGLSIGAQMSVESKAGEGTTISVVWHEERAEETHD